MTATTVKVDPTDTLDTVTVAAGGTPGTKALEVIIDHSKFTTQAQVRLALERAAEAVTENWPLPAS